MFGKLFKFMRVASLPRARPSKPDIMIIYLTLLHFIMSTGYFWIKRSNRYIVFYKFIDLVIHISVKNQMDI